MKIKNITVFQAISMDGASALSFDEKNYELWIEGNFMYIKSKRNGMIKGTSFSNIQCFVPDFTPGNEILKQIKQTKAKTKEQGHAQC